MENADHGKDENDVASDSNLSLVAGSTVLAQVLLAIIRANPVGARKASEQHRLAKALEALLGNSARQGRKPIDDRNAHLAMAEGAMKCFVEGQDFDLTALAEEAKHLTSGASDAAIVARLRRSFLPAQGAVMAAMSDQTDAAAGEERRLVLAILNHFAAVGVRSVPPTHQFKSTVVSLGTEQS
ncbi:hypothetical protein D3C73_397170 [compost metagenome]